MFIRFFLPLFSPFLLGGLLALAAEPMVSFLNRRLRIPRGISCCLGVTMAFFLLSMVLLLAAAFLLRELKAVSGMLPDLGEAARSALTMAQNWSLTLTDRAPESLQPLMRQSLTNLFADSTSLLEKAARFVLGFAGNLLTHVPNSALTLGTGLISAYLISAKLPRLRRWLLVRIPRQRLQAIRTGLTRMKTALTGWLFAQAKLMGLTLLILLAGFWLLRIPKFPLWALAVTAVDALPVLGTGTILLPWALLRLLQQDAARALGLLGLYTTITLTRSMLEPKLVGRQLGLDSLATLMALYIGYKLWGIGGMILSPLLAVTALQLVPEKR